MEFYFQSNSIMNMNNAISQSHWATDSLNYSQSMKNKHWTIRRRDDCGIIPSTYRPTVSYTGLSDFSTEITEKNCPLFLARLEGKKKCFWDFLTFNGDRIVSALTGLKSFFHNLILMNISNNTYVATISQKNVMLWKLIRYFLKL